MQAEEIKVGHKYRAKKPKAIGPQQQVDDRQVLYVGFTQVQYDSPSVIWGKQYPRISMEKFLKWAGEDITDTLPEGQWKNFDEYKSENKLAKAKKSSNDEVDITEDIAGALVG